MFFVLGGWDGDVPGTKDQRLLSILKNSKMLQNAARIIKHKAERETTTTKRIKNPKTFCNETGIIEHIKTKKKK